MMDEPFRRIDEITRDRLNEPLQQLWQRERRTVVLSPTHCRGGTCPPRSWSCRRAGAHRQGDRFPLPDERRLDLRDTTAFVGVAHAVREALAEGHHD